MIDTNEIAHRILVKLLIDKSVITREEYENAVRGAVREETKSEAAFNLMVGQIIGEPV
jgi:hypothetical protein